MEKKQAQEYIKQVLNSRFDQEQFELFVRNLLNEYEPKDNGLAGARVWEAFKDHVQSYKRIGKYTDPEGDIMDILIIKVKSLSKLERTRTALRNFVVRHLKEFGDKSYALTAFYSDEDDGADWRFSLVKIDVETERNEQGKIKTKEIANPAKRFSFLVGENENAHTAQKQLLPLLVNDHSNPLIIKEKDGDGSVEGAFSIEKVTDEFYEQYKDLYLKLTENAALTETLEKEGIVPVRFVKKLLGQIVFLYFLQKKGWLGVPRDQKMGEGPRNFLRKKFDEINETGANYFNTFLRYLFYEALAKEHNDQGIKYFNKRLGCKIPFLNGGLFEADYKDWESLTLDIDNTLFSNPNEKNKAGDKGTGILDVFDRYNFTIREDEPLEKEVAVDPEMLGKVFENLLDVTDRKSKGAFYTPREIVHYMCQESLIHYLDSSINNYTESYQPIDSDQTSLIGGSTDKKGNLKIELVNKGNIRVPKNDIEHMIRKGHLVLENETTVTGKGKETDTYQYKIPESIRKHAKELDQALANIKICDPAIGSGAFPVGMLQEIVTARKVLVPYLSQDYIHMLQHQSSIADSDTMPSDYYFKRHAIQESIYGVDIDASAIDIARLRLWLSMIVDEEDYETIEALPNLDYKIVCGNSLIGLPEQGASRYPGLSDHLEDLKEQFFNETDEAKKKSLRNQINDQINKVLNAAEDFEGYKIDFDFKLFFSEVWHQKNGFDVVIGNPPYVRVQGIDNESKELFKGLYLSATGKYDLYVLFLEKGDSILNRNGTLIFINPNKFFNADYGVGIRNYYSRNKNVKAVIDFGDTQNFSTATTYTCIIQTTNSPNNSFFYHLWNPDTSSLSNLKFISRNHFDINEKWKLLSNIKVKIFDQLKKGSVSLIECTDEIFQGLISGGDKLFFLELIKENENNYECKSLFDSRICVLEKAVTRKLLKGKEAKAYKYPNVKYVTIYPYKSNNGKTQLLTELELKNYPNVFDYLNSIKEELDSRGSKNMKYQSWYSMWNNRDIEKFQSPKLLTQVLSGSPNFGVDKKGEFWFVGGGNAGVYGIIPSNPNLLMFFSGLLNSEIVAFYVSESSTKFRGGYYSFAKRFLADFPVVINSSFVTPISILSTYLFDTELNTLAFTFFRQLNNGIIFELYFPQEIRSGGKEILVYLGDLKAITDDMSNEEKLAIIQSEFERLYDPNHPVRNNLETLDSVEEVRIIKDALK